MSVKSADILVVGAGPAGLAAAIEASRCGASVVIADENPKPGGQLLKQTHKFFGSERHYAGTRGIDIGARLIDEAYSREIQILLETPVVGIFEDLVIMAMGQERLLGVRPKCTILATGAGENTIAFPGWTLPGVVTAGAAQTFVNVHRVLIGKRAVVVGSGNVGLIVAYQLRQAGMDVAAIVEAMPNVGGWGVHAAKVRRLGVPILPRHTIAEARGTDHVSEVVIQQIDGRYRPVPGTTSTLEADTICLAVGMAPRTRLAEMAGCEFTVSPALGGRIPVHSLGMQTSVPRCYLAGDVSGIEEASTAIEEGKLAGLSAAAALGLLDPDVYQEQVRACSDALSELRSGPFGDARKTAKDDVVRTYERNKA